MAIIIDGNNTPTLGGVGYGDGTELAFTAAGTAGQPVVSGGASAPVFRPYTLPAADGSASQVLQTNGSGALSFATPSSGFTLGTPINATSGTVITFTGISAGAKQVIVNFKGVSSNSTSNFSIQLGTSGGFATSGYESQATSLLNGSPYITLDQSTTLFVVTGSRSVNSTSSGSITFTLENASTNIWVAHGVLSSYIADKMQVSGGYVTLSGALTQLRIQALGDTFDEGAINIAYI